MNNVEPFFIPRVSVKKNNCHCIDETVGTTVSFTALESREEIPTGSIQGTTYYNIGTRSITEIEPIYSYVLTSGSTPPI